MSKEVVKQKTYLKMEDKNLTTPEELVAKIKKYKNYFGDEGGVTFSGGDPLCQPEFLLECLKLCKQENIHTMLTEKGKNIFYNFWNIQ